jgi:hypothetical protein
MAFESGLLEEAPAGSTLLRRHPYLFEANLWSDRITTERSAFYFATTGRIYRLLAIEDNVMPPKNNYALRPPVFFVYFDSQYALAGQLAFADAHASIANEREPGIKLSSLRVFSRSTQGKPERLMLPLRIEQTGIEQERGCRDWLEMPRQTLRSTSTGSLESLVAKTDNAFLENLEGPCRLP